MSVVSDSVWPHRRQPTRLPLPWGSPGKNTGVGCHFLLQCMQVKSESEVAQSCPTLHDPMDCSPPGSSIPGIFQARVLEWGAIAFSMFDSSKSKCFTLLFVFALNFQNYQCFIPYSMGWPKTHLDFPIRCHRFFGQPNILSSSKAMNSTGWLSKDACDKKTRKKNETWDWNLHIFSIKQSQNVYQQLIP